MAIAARVFLSLTAVLLATACSSLGGRPVAGPCTSGVCKADVTVQDCVSGALTVVPDPLPVPGANNLEWTIATPGYRFPPDGTVPSNGIVIAGSGFTPNPGVTGSGKKFKVHDAYTDIRPHIKYALRVIRESDGVACKPYDPFINNQ